MAGGMEDVELVELPGPGASRDAAGRQAPDRVALRQARLRRWWPVPVVAVAALVAWQVVTDARDRDRVERARELEGVVAETIQPPLEATRWGGDDTMQVLYGGVTVSGGLLVGPTYLADRSVTVAAVDRATGAERWRTPVARTADDSLTGPGVSCQQPEPADAATVWCTVSEPVTLADGSPGTRARAVELDAADGTVLTDRELGTAGTAAAVGDLAVLASGGPESVRVTGVDLSTGGTRWDVTLPERVPADLQPAVWASGGHALVRGTQEVWVLDPADGSTRAHGVGVDVRADGLLAATDAQGVTSLLDADGSPTGVSAPGVPLGLQPDDGSASGLMILTQDEARLTRTVRAVDTGTGEVVWDREVDLGTTMNVVLLDGVLYGSGAESVWALDAATGEPRWSTAAGPSDDWLVPTDGRVLLRSERGAGGSELVGYDLRDGGEAWRTALPTGIGSVWERYGLLVGDGGEGAVVLR